MDFPKFLRLPASSADRVKLASFFGAVATAAACYAETGNVALATSTLVFAVLSGNIVGRKDE